MDCELAEAKKDFSLVKVQIIQSNWLNNRSIGRPGWRRGRRGRRERRRMKGAADATPVSFLSGNKSGNNLLPIFRNIFFYYLYFRTIW